MEGAESGEKFCLKWNDFDSNLKNSFQKFRDEKDFFDVTLVCEEEQIDAHKMILSASSSFFKNLFRRNHHQYPLIVLKGVKSSELSALLQFVYQGEVNVAKEDLTSFLEAAQELKIHGLTNDLQNEESKQQKQRPSKTRSPKPEKKPPPPPHSNHAPEPPPEIDSDVLVPALPDPNALNNIFDDSNDDIAEVIEDPLGQHATSLQPFFSEFEESHHSSSADFSEDNFMLNNSIKGTCTYNSLRMTKNMGKFILIPLLLDSYSYDSLMTKVFDSNGLHVFECNVCKKVQRRKDHMKNHVQTHLSQEVKCDFCSTMCKNPASLKVHVSQKHRQLQNKYLNVSRGQEEQIL